MVPLYFLRIFSIASEVGAKPSHLVALLQKMLLQIKGRFFHVKNQDEYVCLWESFLSDWAVLQKTFYDRRIFKIISEAPICKNWLRI